MKHIWFIDEDEFVFGEGYVVDNYKEYNYLHVYIGEDFKKNFGIYKVGNFYDNKETALNIYKGMIDIERVKVHNEIERLKKYDEQLFEKLLSI